MLVLVTKRGRQGCGGLAGERLLWVNVLFTGWWIWAERRVDNKRE